MEESTYSEFEYWQKQKRDEFPDVTGMNYTIAKLAEETAFLWTSMSGAPPCSSSVGMWEFALNVQGLVGYIRYVYLENFFEIWLKRDQLDHGQYMIKAEDLFRNAEEINDLEVKKDIPLMKEIIEEIDSIWGLASDEMFAGLQRALDKFNARWNHTSTWCFDMKIYNDAIEVGKALFNNNRDNIQTMYFDYIEEHAENNGYSRIEDEISKDQWLEICKGIYSDKAKLDLFLNVLRNSNYF